MATYAYEDEGLTRLQAPQRDAEALSEVLADPEIGDFDVRTIVNQPAHVVNVEVARFFADRRPGDLLLLHFSCHGVKDDSGELYFATTDTRLDVLEATAVSSSFVNRVMGRSRSARVVLLLDCCYAGAFARGLVSRGGPGLDLNERLGGRGRAVITASTALQFAFEGGDLTEGADPGEVSPSVFTRALVAGLRSGDADRDLDGRVSLDELYGYVYDEVTTASPHQTPGKWVFGLEGDLYVARRRAPVTVPAALPREIEESIESPLPWHRESVVRELERILRARHPGRALAARIALQRLAEDDSRQVSTRATAALEAALPTQRASLESSSGPGGGSAESARDESAPHQSAPDETSPDGALAAHVVEDDTGGTPSRDLPADPRPPGRGPQTRILPPVADPPERSAAVRPDDLVPASSRRGRTWPRAALIAATLLVVAAAPTSWLLLHRESDAGARGRRLPDTRLVLSIKREGVARLISFDTASGRETADLASTTGRIPVLSPDRRSVVYAVGPSLKTPDSKRFLLQVAPIDGKPVPLLDAEAQKHCPYAGRPTWDPDDSSRLAMLCRDDDGHVTGIAELHDQRLTLLVQDTGITQSDPTWLAHDSIVFAKQDRENGPAHLYQVSVADPRRVERLRLVGLGTGSGTESDSDPVSSHGRLLFVRAASIGDGGTGALMVRDDNGETRQVEGLAGSVRFPTWSPNGDRVAFVKVGTDGNRLWVGPLDRPVATDENDAHLGPPSWGRR